MNFKVATDGSLSKKYKAVILALETSETPLSPKEIAFRTGLNHSTTRCYLRRLLSQGKVNQPYRGYYVAKPTYGVGKPPRVHNLRVGFKAKVKRSEDVRERWDDCRLRVLFGVKRGYVSGWISSERGLDLTSCLLVVQRFKDVASSRLGWAPGDKEISVTTCEFNEDFAGVRLDGLSCVTVESFFGALERLYNKAEGLRSEVKVQPESLESVYAVLKGGVSQYNILQSNFALMRKVEALVEAVKWQNRELQTLGKLFRAVVFKKES